MVAEPVGAGLVRLVAVDPDHDVTETQNLDQEREKDGQHLIQFADKLFIAALSDLHDGGDADGGEVERVDGLDLHAGAEGARGLNVPGGGKL